MNTNDVALSLAELKIAAADLEATHKLVVQAAARLDGARLARAISICGAVSHAINDMRRLCTVIEGDLRAEGVWS